MPGLLEGRPPEFQAFVIAAFEEGKASSAGKAITRETCLVQLKTRMGALKVRADDILDSLRVTPSAAESVDEVARRVRAHVEANWTVVGVADTSRRLGFSGTFAPHDRQQLPAKCETGPAGVVTFTTSDSGVVCAAYPYRDAEGTFRARLAFAAPGAPILEHDLERWGGGTGGGLRGNWMFLQPTPDTEEPGDRERAAKNKAMADCAPKDLDSAMACLDAHWSDETKQTFRALPAKDVIGSHFGVGMWIRNNWGLWKGGPLKDFFVARGVSHPDNMSGVMMNAYWLKLQGCRLASNDTAAVEAAFQEARHGRECVNR
ncbi:DUF6794 domain-containing protein [Phenylobacterium zucineum]|nr:DUF6794 domain-containing protein [Phenylobacterium zucineum]